MKRLTLRNAIASAPHCVTTSVSLVSRVRVSAIITKNLMAPMRRNFLTSFLWIGKTALATFERDDWGGETSFTAASTVTWPIASVEPLESSLLSLIAVVLPPLKDCISLLYLKLLSKLWSSHLSGRVITNVDFEVMASVVLDRNVTMKRIGISFEVFDVVNDWGLLTNMCDRIRLRVSVFARM